MNRLLAFAWLVIIGTNVAEYYSEATPYHGAVILAGAAYFLFVFRGELLRLVFFNDYLLVLAILVVPILLMLLSDRSFERGDVHVTHCQSRWYLLLHPCWHCEPNSTGLWRSRHFRLWQSVRR